MIGNPRITIEYRQNKSGDLGDGSNTHFVSHFDTQQLRSLSRQTPQEIRSCALIRNKLNVEPILNQVQEALEKLGMTIADAFEGTDTKKTGRLDAEQTLALLKDVTEDSLETP
eukprot:scaffold12819_cov15-Prasinocladus_malaysianus.AAC.1